MPTYKLQLLGGVTLGTAQSPCPLRLGHKGAALMALVAAQGAAGAARALLIARLWADCADDDARNALRQCLHHLRHSVGDAELGLDSEGDRIVLREDHCAVDVRDFERLAAATDLDSQLAAADLYRGDFVDGLDAGDDFGPWAAAERERLREVAQSLLARLAGLALPGPQADGASALARRLLAADPLHEGAYRALIEMHMRCGLRAKAAQVWRECRHALQRELGVAPSAQTTVAVERLLAETPAVVTSMLAAAPARAHAGGAAAAGLDAMLRGWQLFSFTTADTNRQARAVFEGVTLQDAGHAEAMAMVGFTHWFDALHGWCDAPERSLAAAGDWSARALACNRGSSAPHSLQGKLLLWRMAHDAATAQLQRALALAPHSAYAHFHLGEVAMWSGRCDEALALVERALELDANDHGMFLTIRAMALWMQGDLRAARATALSAVTRNPAYAWAQGTLAAILAEQGELDAACHAAAAARQLNARLSIDFAQHVLPFRLPEPRQRMAASWQRAGMPTAEAGSGISLRSPAASA